jgi:N,N'-diacetylchitobiose phosphorylase
MLGVRLTFEGLIIDPCIPSDWKEFSVTRRWRGAVYNISVNNSAGVQKGVKNVFLNGSEIQGPINPMPAGSVNKVEVYMG